MAKCVRHKTVNLFFSYECQFAKKEIDKDKDKRKKIIKRCLGKKLSNGQKESPTKIAAFMLKQSK